MGLVREFQDILVHWFTWLKIKVPRAYSTNWYFQCPLVLLMNRKFWKSLDWSYFSGIWMAWLAIYIYIYSIMLQSVTESNKQNLRLDLILFLTGFHSFLQSFFETLYVYKKWWLEVFCFNLYSVLISGLQSRWLRVNFLFFF